jgi:hypothetical protein
MSRAEKFIEDYTRNCSNQYDLPEYFENGIKRLKEYQPWLTPDQAKRAVEIAREEIYEWLANHYRDYMHNPTGKKLEAFFGGDMISDLDIAMKDE